MKQRLIIASFNTQNPNMQKNPNWEEKVKELCTLIKDQELDIICCQEMLKQSVDSLSQQLKNYHTVGNYRYGNNFFSKNISILKRYNEATPIISKQKIIKVENYKLPWIPKTLSDLKKGIFQYHSITPRIATEALIEIYPQYFIKVINTHLDKKILAVKKRQLKKLQKVIANSTYPVILTGDFNMEVDHPLFQNFVNSLAKNHLKRVDFNRSTLKKSKGRTAIDHIFIPEEYQVIEVKKVDNTISDHYLILVKLEIPL